MQLATLVSASELTASTRKRSEKTRALVAALEEASESEIAVAVGFLSGRPRQGRIGIGWATLQGVEVAAAAESSLTLHDVDATLGKLDELEGVGVEQRRNDVVSALLTRATAAEQTFLRRLLIGELRQGALEGVVTDAVAIATGVKQTSVRRAAMLTGDLGAAAEVAVRAGEAGLGAVRLTLFTPLKPMLAATAGSVDEALEALGESFVEWKLDGARIQVHRDARETRIYTRSLNDVTSRLPGIVEQAAAFRCKSCVLDGEAIALGAAERPAVFQDTMSRFGRASGADSSMVGFFFDCLHRDGVDLIDEAFSTRRAVLEELTGAAATPGLATKDAAAAAAVLEEALAAGHEGVMVKATDGPYQAGRRGRTWRKIKPVVTVDLVVIAADWGHGRRQGWLSNLHLGARDPDGDFVMVGKTFKGMTDELLQWQTAELSARETARRRITVEVRPELVVEIALDGVQRSTRYPGGVALRFARVKGYRSDKAPAEATTIDELRAMLGGDGEEQMAP